MLRFEYEIRNLCNYGCDNDINKDDVTKAKHILCSKLQVTV